MVMSSRNYIAKKRKKKTTVEEGLKILFIEHHHLSVKQMVNKFGIGK